VGASKKGSAKNGKPLRREGLERPKEAYTLKEKRLLSEIGRTVRSERKKISWFWKIRYSGELRFIPEGYFTGKK